MSFTIHDRPAKNKSSFGNRVTFGRKKEEIPGGGKCRHGLSFPARGFLLSFFRDRDKADRHDFLLGIPGVPGEEVAADP